MEASKLYVSNVDALLDFRERPLTDAGNADRFADLNADRFRYVPEWCAWYQYDGRRWARDVHGAAQRAALATVRRMYEDAGTLEDSGARKALAAHALKSESAQALRHMLEIARTNARLVTRADRFDSGSTRYLFNVLNGTLDVRAGELRRHDPAALITKLAPVTFDASASWDLWEAFLARILPDPEVLAYLQRYVGAALTGDTGDQCFPLFYGEGANGKSTLLAVLLRLFGEYGHQADFETFLQSTAHTDRRGGARADLVALRAARLVCAIEAGDGRRLNETLIKSLTGGDAITARGNYEREQTTFTPQLHLVLSANERPRIHGDLAIWRRVHAVEFPVVIPEHERDATLPERLTNAAALSGVLTWALVGARDWYEAGAVNRLRPPAAVVAATADYRDGQDLLAAFLADRCELEPDAWTPTKALRAAYAAWCEANGERAVGDTTWRTKLQARGLKAGRRGYPAVRGWAGIRLVEET